MENLLAVRVRGELVQALKSWLPGTLRGSVGCSLRLITERSVLALITSEWD